MSLTLTAAKLTSSSDVQVFNFQPADEQKLAKRGRLWIIVNSNSSGVLELKGRVSEAVETNYYGILSSDVLEALKNTLTEVVDYSKSPDQVEMGAIVSISNAVYVCGFGGVKAYLYRDGALVNLTPASPNLSSSSGLVKDQDTFVVGTRTFFASFSKGELRTVLGMDKPFKIVDKLSARVGVNELSSRMGAIFLKAADEVENESVNDSSAIKSLLGGRTETATPKSFGIAIKQTAFAGKLLAKPKSLLGFVDKLKTLRVQESSVAISKRRKTLMSVGAAFLVLLVVSIAFGIKQKRDLDLKMSYEEDLSSASHDYDEAMSLMSINSDRARELFVESKQKVESLKQRGIEDGRLVELGKLIDDHEGDVLGEYRQDAALFMDLGLLSDGFEGDSIVASSGFVYVFDKEGKKIASIEVSTKRSEIVAGPSEIGEAKKLAAYAGNIYVLDNDGVYRVGNGREKLVDKDWDGDALIFVYAANVYVLAKGDSKILRYAGVEGDFGSGKNWLRDDVQVDLSSSDDWIIDGAIWTVGGSKMAKFALGNPQNFSINGVFPSIDNIDGIYTDEESDYLYLLDKQNNRIVAIDKQGNYKVQYLTEALGNARDFVVSEDAGVMLVLTGDKLLSIQLEHAI